MTVPSFCKIVFAVVFLFLGYIPVNVTFWIERWSESGDEVNTLHSVCFDRENDRCCQTFEDRYEQTPEWISHLFNSMITAYVFATLTSILLVVKCIRDYRFVDIITAVFSLGTALCLAISVGIFDQNYKEVSAFNQHRHGPSFFLSFVCIFIYLILAVILVVINCFDVQVNYKVNPVKRPTSPPRPATIPQNDAPIVKADKLVYRELAGNNLTLSCTITSSSLKKVTWIMKANNTERTLDLGNQRYNQEFLLSPRRTIQNLKPSDTGKYRCFATNENRTGASEYISVEVLYLPKVEADRTEYYSIVGRDINIKAHIYAFPAPSSVRWVQIFNNEEPREMNRSNCRFDIRNPSSSILKMERPTANQTGSYQCIVENTIGIGKSKPISVQISYEPIVTCTKTSYTKHQGEDIELIVSVKSLAPLTLVYWEKFANDEVLEIEHSVSESPCLKIEDLKVSDIGIYQCFVHNDAGVGFSPGIDVNVIQRRGQNSNPDVTICCVCMDRPKEVVFLPCRHRACCEQCGYDILNYGSGNCPICMRMILEIFKAYEV